MFEWGFSSAGVSNLFQVWGRVLGGHHVGARKSFSKALHLHFGFYIESWYGNPATQFEMNRMFFSAHHFGQGRIESLNRGREVSVLASSSYLSHNGADVDILPNCRWSHHWFTARVPNSDMLATCFHYKRILWLNHQGILALRCPFANRLKFSLFHVWNPNHIASGCEIWIKWMKNNS